MKLYGTTTSPFVRRVRIVALELGVPFELISTATPEGEAELRRHTPLWKIPTAVFTEDAGERVVFDSHAIIDYLIARIGHGPLRPPGTAGRWHESNLIHAIDGALESAIQVLYLERDGIPSSAASYLTRQVQRTESTLSWVESQLSGSTFFEDPRMGLAEFALLTTVEWLDFRKRFSFTSHPGLVGFMGAHAARPSVRQTSPVALP